MTWTDEQRATLRRALAHVERRIASMPPDLSGSATLHMQSGELRRIEFRFLEPIETEEASGREGR